MSNDLDNLIDGCLIGIHDDHAHMLLYNDPDALNKIEKSQDKCIRYLLCISLVIKIVAIASLILK